MKSAVKYKYIYIYIYTFWVNAGYYNLHMNYHSTIGSISTS